MPSVIVAPPSETVSNSSSPLPGTPSGSTIAARAMTATSSGAGIVLVQELQAERAAPDAGSATRSRPLRRVHRVVGRARVQVDALRLNNAVVDDGVALSRLR